jgi:hypothetical protein
MGPRQLVHLTTFSGSLQCGVTKIVRCSIVADGLVEWTMRICRAALSCASWTTSS